MKKASYKKIIILSTIILTLFCCNLNVKANSYECENNKLYIETKLFEDYGGIFGTDTVGQPLYYINIVIDMIKYSAMIALIGMSIADFVKAIVSDDKGALKKAGVTSVKRFIYCVMIFFLPIIIDFLIDLFQINFINLFIKVVK